MTIVGPSSIELPDALPLPRYARLPGTVPAATSSKWNPRSVAIFASSCDEVCKTYCSNRASELLSWRRRCLLDDVGTGTAACDSCRNCNLGRTFDDASAR
jgi:hypothetical protein